MTQLSVISVSICLICLSETQACGCFVFASVLLLRRERNHYRKMCYPSRTMCSSFFVYLFPDQYTHYLTLISSLFRNLNAHFEDLLHLQTRVRVACLFSSVLGIYKRLCITVKEICSSMHCSWKLLVNECLHCLNVRLKLSIDLRFKSIIYSAC